MNWKNNFPKENRYFETDNGILYKGDCLKIMELFEKNVFDAIITDLPYGATRFKWDFVIPFDEMWKRLKKIRKDRTPIVLFGSEPFSSLLRISNLKEYKYDWYWQKERVVNVFQVKKRAGLVIETISVFYKKQCLYNPQKTKYDGKKRTNKVKNGTLGKLIDNSCKTPKEYQDDGTRYPIQVLKFKRDILKSNLHPTQKPIALMEYLVKTYTNENDLVLDFTCGSGTTLVACEKLNRRWIGIELEEQYCEITKRRIEECK